MKPCLGTTFLLIVISLAPIIATLLPDHFNDSSSYLKSPKFPRIPFEAKPIKLFSPGVDNYTALPFYQNSMVIRLNGSLLISTYDDFHRSVSHIVVSLDNGQTWIHTNRIHSISSLNLFLKKSGKGKKGHKRETLRLDDTLYAIGHNRIGRFVNGKPNNLYILHFNLESWLSGDPSESIPYKRLKISTEYNFLTSNSGVFIRGHYLLKQLDVIPQNSHPHHYARVMGIEGRIEQGQTLHIHVRYINNAHKVSPLKQGMMPHTLSARFSPGMKVGIPCLSMSAYIQEVVVEDNGDSYLVVEVIKIRKNPGHEKQEEKLRKTPHAQRILFALQDANNWWYTVLYVDLRKPLMVRDSWKLTNVVCSLNNMHYQDVEDVLKIGMPTPRSPPYPKKIYPHAEEGTIVPNRHGGISVYLRYSNQRLCDLAMEIPIYRKKNDSFHFWLQTPHLTALPGFGRTHPGLAWDAQTDSYWMISNVGRSLGSVAKLPGHYFRESQKCIIERNAVGLYFSRDMESWYFLGMLDFENWSWFQLSYPFVVVDSSDLLITMRTTTRFGHGYHNHNANAIFVYRIPNFRDLVLLNPSSF